MVANGIRRDDARGMAEVGEGRANQHPFVPDPHRRTMAASATASATGHGAWPDAHGGNHGLIHLVRGRECAAPTSRLISCRAEVRTRYEPAPRDSMGGDAARRLACQEIA